MNPLHVNMNGCYNISECRTWNVERRLMTKLKAYLSLARISNAPTLVSNVLVGSALAMPLSPDIRLPSIILAVFMFYTAGMFFNDICDREIDRKERPERPIPSGVVSVAEATFIVAMLFAAGLGLLWPWGHNVLVAGVALFGLIVLYDIWHKKNPFSPVVMGACRGTVYVIAFLAFASSTTPQLWIAAGWMVLYISSLTWIARSENTNQLSSYLPASLPFLPAIYYLVFHTSTWMIVAVLLYTCWTTYSLKFVYGEKHRNIGRAVGYLIAGISLFDGILLTNTGTTWWLLIAWSCFGSTLFFQRTIKGT